MEKRDTSKAHLSIKVYSIYVLQMGVMRGTTLGMEHMRKDKGGKGGLVINVSSSTG